MKKQNLVYALKKEDDLLIGLYLGVWAGDGTQFYDNGYRIKICCHSKDKKMIAFFKNILRELFGKTVTRVSIEERHRALLKFNSKFIFNFPSRYLDYTKNKTHTISLKNPLNEYSSDFLDGFLLGLTLTDGYLKERFQFNVTSENLAKNVFRILERIGFKPHMGMQNREKYGWKNLHTVSLRREESRKLLNLFDNILIKAGSIDSFKELKYEGV